MVSSKNEDFGAQMAKILPVLIQEVTSSQQSFLTKGDMTLPNIVILDILRARGEAAMGYLAKSLHLSMGSVTGIIDKMIDKDLVIRKRSKKDRRVVNIMPSKKGNKIAQQVSDERRDMTNKLYSVLTEKERDEYLRLLKKVCDNIKEK